MNTSCCPGYLQHLQSQAMATREETFVAPETASLKQSTSANDVSLRLLGTEKPSRISPSLPRGKPDAGPFVEKRYRSLIKAVSWRATGTLDTILISFLVTGQIKLAVSIGFIELFTKVGLYYLHERVWMRIPFGRSYPREDYSI